MIGRRRRAAVTDEVDHVGGVEWRGSIVTGTIARQQRRARDQGDFAVSRACYVNRSCGIGRWQRGSGRASRLHNQEIVTRQDYARCQISPGPG